LPGERALHRRTDSSFDLALRLKTSCRERNFDRQLLLFGPTHFRNVSLVLTITSSNGHITYKFIYSTVIFVETTTVTGWGKRLRNLETAPVTNETAYASSKNTSTL
jgi:hypothetical protein